MFHPQQICTVVSCLLFTACTSAQDFPTFKHVVIDPDVGRVCYAVTVADVDGDGKRDIVAVTESRVLWYQNPSWKKYTIIDNQTPTDNVCIAAHDIDGDGQIDFALGAGWTQKGTLHWLSRNKSLNTPWNVHAIGQELWTHRMRWADVLDTGTPQLVVSPLNASVESGVRLTAFQIPKNPRTDRWAPVVLNSELNRMHNHWHVDFDNNGTADTLTASQEGINLIRRERDQWMRIKIGHGADANSLKQRGAGEVKIGHLAGGKPFLVTVEPMHGHSVAVYTPAKQKTDLWNRHVVATGFKRGHALWTTDLDGDGDDEFVFGHSDTADTFGVIAFDCTSQDKATWQQHVLDSGSMATEDLFVDDLTGDGRPDVVAGGRATHNVKLYIQQP